MKRIALGSLPLLLLVTACPNRSVSKVDPQQEGAVVKHIPVSADIDILFVVDNSASTADKQTVFAANFPKFVAALDAFPTGRPNLHIAVVDTTVDIGVQGYAPGCPSPDPADNGLFQNAARVPGCSPPTGSFISDIKNADGTRTVNYAGTLDVALSCIAQVGSSGCGFEAPLEAMKRALDGSQPANAGFIRDGAYLAVIFLTDEDDASVRDDSVFLLPDATVGGHNDFRVQPLFAYTCDQPISATMGGDYTNCVPRTDSYLQITAFYEQFLRSVKNPAQIVVAAVAGPPPNFMTNDTPPQFAANLNGNPSATDIVTGAFTLGGNTQALALEPSCEATINGNPAYGRPGVRLADFITSFGDRGRYYTVCQPDYSAALTDIGATLFNAISPCLEGPIDPRDTDPNNPGVQLQCTVSDAIAVDTPDEVETVIPACRMSDATTPDPNGVFPCWGSDMNTTTCPAPDTGYELNVVRTQPAAINTTVVAECGVAP